MADRPNILFVMTDQQRGDSVGADPVCPTDGDGHPLVHTPNVNNLLKNGCLFSRAYSPTPTCLPARRCLWTGQTPVTNGCPGWVMEEWDFEHTLPGELTKAGYQTRLVGKSHSIPKRNHFGFEHMVLNGGFEGSEFGFEDASDDYSKWLERESEGAFSEISHGSDRNSWDPRPSHLSEHLHSTNWTTNRALRFLKNRDPTRPFFLTVSYFKPHQPFDPPPVYYEMYDDQSLPDPYMGDWTDSVYGDKLAGYPHARGYYDRPGTNDWCLDVSPTLVDRARACYYGLVTHLDHQIGRVLRLVEQLGEWDDTFVVFTSDHGEMLGDHYLWRKSYAYEGSARVPLLLKWDRSTATDVEPIIDRPVGLEDIMPTLLDVADVDVPSLVEGRTLLDLLDTPERDDWRDHYHGEQASILHPENAMQYFVTERTKYIWNPVTGDELLFDLEADPGETINLANDPERQDELEEWRRKMVDHLAGRDEGFTDGEQLIAKERPYNWTNRGSSDRVDEGPRVYFDG